MADRVPITVTEGNDEKILVTINRMFLSDDLLQVITVEFFLKDANCVDDSAALLLSSTNPAQVVILTHTSAQITATVYLPASALRGAYPRQYRVDGLNATGKRRTAVFGPVTVNNV